MVNTPHTPIKPFPTWLFATLIALAIGFGVMTLYAYINKSSATIKQPELENQYHDLLNQTDIINTSWMRTLNPTMKKVEGHIIWSSNKQQGIMIFSGLPASKKNQKYHLWIYDLESAANTRVSAHTFAIKYSSLAKVLVPVNARDIVKTPFKFELVIQHKDKDHEDILLLAQP